MTRRFTTHEPRPLRDAGPKAPPAAKPDKSAGPTKAKKPGAESETPETGAETGTETGTETGGPSGPEPTRYGDWERKGICVDF